ncbi:prepilin-type N-terminal cleavage/methylation domain-containing protein [Pirellulales bacterium]|nr:prepilin-type N-terminal cleavage/methylation domain-containing protein [Pirellulales bacterium]
MSTFKQNYRSGMTLIEMLIATAVSLILMAAVAQVFAAFSGAMSNGRSILETDSRLRNVARRLRDDLNGATTQMLPPRTPDQGEGYFEIIEGPINDLFPSTSEDRDADGVLDGREDANNNGVINTGEDTNPTNGVLDPSEDSDSSGGLNVPTLNPTLQGDTDDVLLFTTHSKTTSFVGRMPPNGRIDLGEDVNGNTVINSEDINGNGRIDPGEDSNLNGVHDSEDQPETVESQTAEVVWFLRETPGTTNPVTYTLYRRQMVVLGYVPTVPFSAIMPDTGGKSPGSNNRLPYRSYEVFDGVDFDSDGIDDNDEWKEYFLAPCDVSVRRENNFLIPNTLSDLTRRENRFLHNPSGDTTGGTFPYGFVGHQNVTAPDGLVFDGTARRGEDIVLTNVLGFDVRVFDPAAPIRLASSTAVVPGDDFNLLYFTTAANGTGAYVDLGHNVRSNTIISANPLFSGFGNSLSGLNGSATSRRTYCTWSTHYEANGIDEDGIDGTDQGTDGLDSSTPLNSLVDESSEQETSPPYPYPLRGVEVRIRVYEPRSRQVRQVTVRHTFVPH